MACALAAACGHAQTTNVGVTNLTPAVTPAGVLPAPTQAVTPSVIVPPAVATQAWPAAGVSVTTEEVRIVVPRLPSNVWETVPPAATNTSVPTDVAPTNAAPTDAPPTNAPPTNDVPASATPEAAAPVVPVFAYVYKDTEVKLTASPDYVAFTDRTRGGECEVLGRSMGMVLDGLSASAPLKQRGILLFRAAGAAAARAGQARQVCEMLASSNDVPVQPVFDQVGALLIPSDEIVVAFATNRTLDQARALLIDPWRDWGITDVREKRPDVFVAHILNPYRGRAYAVARALAAQPDVLYAEPNQVAVMKGR